MPYTIFYGFLFIFLFALLNLYKQNKNMEIRVVCNKEIYNPGEEDEFIIIINNVGLLPAPNIVVKSRAIGEINGEYKGDALIVMGNTNKWIRSMVKFKHRGIYDFGYITIESSDLFQIFKHTKVMHDEKIIRVYPKIYGIENIFSSNKDIFKNAKSKKSRIEDMYSICDVRKYREGDSFKRIHWKLSAKCGELFVKNFDTVCGEKSNIFLNMNVENMELEREGILEEEMVDFCMSLVNYMETEKINCKVYINSSLGREFDINNHNDVTVLGEFFLKQKSDAEENYVRFIKSNLNKITKLSVTLIIVGKLDENFKNNLIAIKDQGYNPLVFYGLEDLQGREYISILKKIGIDCFKIGAILNKTAE